MLIEKYTPVWIENYTCLKKEIENCLNGIECQIEHVGSTSVPNLDSKPIIDIDIIHHNESDFDLIKSALTAIGYYHNGNQGIEKREVFKRDGTSIREVLDTIPHHLYVCPKNSPALERHILSRDFLRKNEWAKLEYQALKYLLADKSNQNKKLYAELKELYINDFIDSIVEKEKSRGF